MWNQAPAESLSHLSSLPQRLGDGVAPCVVTGQRGAPQSLRKIFLAVKLVAASLKRCTPHNSHREHSHGKFSKVNDALRKGVRTWTNSDEA